MVGLLTHLMTAMLTGAVVLALYTDSCAAMIMVEESPASGPASGFLAGRRSCKDTIEVLLDTISVYRYHS
jgi:hypothetical protein